MADGQVPTLTIGLMKMTGGNATIMLPRRRTQSLRHGHMTLKGQDVATGLKKSHEVDLLLNEVSGTTWTRGKLTEKCQVGAEMDIETPRKILKRVTGKVEIFQPGQAMQVGSPVDLKMDPRSKQNVLYIDLLTKATYARLLMLTSVHGSQRLLGSLANAIPLIAMATTSLLDPPNKANPQRAEGRIMHITSNSATGAMKKPILTIQTSKCFGYLF